MQIITYNKSKLTIDLSGGRIAELVLEGTPVLGTFTRIDGKKANTHLCTPNFGKEGTDKYNLPSHGPSRSARWGLVNKSKSSLTIQYNMPKTGSYPTLSISQTFILNKNNFKHTIQVENKGKEKAPANIAIHYYWHTPKGWENIMLNEEHVSSFIKKDTSILLGGETLITIPGQSEVVMNTSSNLKRVQLWTGRAEEKGKIQYDQKYACIEPAIGTDDYFGSKESMLSPNETRKCFVSLSV